MSAFKKFNRNYSQHSPNRSKVLTELTSFLKYTPDQFVIENSIDNLNLVEFFRKLNDILLTDDLNYDYHWVVFQVIEIAIKKDVTLQYLVDTVRIVTGISNFAVKASSSLTEGKQIQLWTLVDRITIGMTVVTEEPFLAALIEHLVRSIKKSDLPKQIKLLQSSILSNLCFKNDVAIACLLRFTKSKDLLYAVQDDRVFWCKMAMAMTRFDCTMFEFELVSYLKTIFSAEYFGGLVRHDDRRLLRNILELLVVGCERDEYSRQIMQQFDFNECIEAVLTLIDDSDTKLQDSEPMNLFLGIVNSILSVSNTSLESNILRLFKLIIECSHDTCISTEAIKTIRLIASTVDVSDSQDLMVTLISRLIETVQSSPDNLSATTEVYQLLSQLHAKYPFIIRQLPKETIEKSIDTQTLSFKLTEANLSMQIHRLKWLFIYTEDISDGKLLTDIVKMKDVHNILANGLRSSNEEILALTMELIRSQSFPVQAVSKILAGTYNPSVRTDSQSSVCGCQCKSSVEYVRPHFSVALETRLNNEINRVSAKLENSNVGVSDYINLLQCQNILASDKEEIMQSQIKSLSDQKTIQTNEIGVLKLAIRNGLNKISELESRIESLKSHKEVLTTSIDTFKTKYDKVTTKLSNINKMYTDEHKENFRIIELKTQQIADLTNQYKTDIAAYDATLQQQKKDHEREKLELEAKHSKELESHRAELVEQHQRKLKKLKAAHEHDLEKYSTKCTEMKNNFEREKADLKIRQTKESQAAQNKMEHLEKQLAEDVKRLEKYAKEIEEKNKILAEKERVLLETNEEVERHKQKFEQLQSILTKK